MSTPSDPCARDGAPHAGGSVRIDHRARAPRRLVATFALAAAVGAPSSRAHGQPESNAVPEPIGKQVAGPAAVPIDPRAALPGSEVARALDALELAQGAEGYVLLREIWRAADQDDPVEIAEALAAVAGDAGTAPPLRSYAGVLEAATRRWRGDLDGAARAVRALGYVTDWLVVGPFDNEGKTGLAEPSGPELTLAEPVVLDRAFEGKRGPVRWRQPPPAAFAWLDWGALLRPRAYVCGWATTFVRATGGPDGGARRIALWAGGSGAFRVYWDDQPVAWDESYRGLDPDRLSVVVDLTTGGHRLTVKSCGDDDSPSVALRLAELDGSAARNVEVEASVEASVAAASALRARRANGAPPATSKLPSPTAPRAPASPAKPAAPDSLGLFGPTSPGRGAAPGALQAFAAALERQPKDPALAAEVARYLLLTGGTPAGSHVARDLARRAAEGAPTVARLLLAGRLAEDRNQRRRWVERAAEIATERADRLEVLLARAALARSSVNPLDAVPLYDQALLLDSTNVEATLGKAELYAEAGLGRTSLAMVERASLVRPHSVALLRALAGQLRALGRDAEAAEIESRYAALRFDDAGFLQLQIDLAAARADRSGVEHWGRRLVAVDPTSSWALGVVARARRAAGDQAGALAAFRDALDAAPDDTATLRALSDLQGELGQRDEQIRLLERLLRLEPQAKDERAYLEALRPAVAAPDEKFAWPAERFLALRTERAPDEERRTLRRLQVTTMLPNGMARRFHQLVFQPLTSEAAAEARQYAFPFHADRQVVEIQAAKVYRADGRVDEALETGSAPADQPALRMYTLQRVFYVQFPRLEVGDVVELRYRIEDVSTPDLLGDSFGESTLLQGPDRTTDSEYVVIAPRESKLRLATSRAPGVEHTEEDAGSHRVHRLHVRNLPSVRPEPAMPPWPELLASAHLSTFSSWTDVGRFYWGLVRDQLDVDDEVRRRVGELTAGLTTDRAKVDAVYHFAANEIRYVGIEFGIEGIQPRRAALTLARGWGDCKDKAALIVSMLRELGIEAEMVLVRTGLRGRTDPSVPSLAAFDHAIAYVPSLDLYLDGTAEQTGTLELPGPDRGAMALRVKSSGGELVTLPDLPPEQSIEQRQLALELRSDGELRVQGRFEIRGAYAPGWRERYAADSTRAERIGQDLASLLGPVELGSAPTDLRVEGLSAPEQPVLLLVQAKARSRAEGDGWSVPVGTSERLVSDYGSLGRRVHPLLLGPQRRREEHWTVVLPTGKKTITLPSPVRLESPFGLYERQVEQQGARLAVRSKLEIRRSRIEPSEYDAWRRFITEVDRASAPRVVVAR